MNSITVSNLIKILIALPQDSKVWLEASDGEISTAINNVTYEKEYNHIIIHCAEHSEIED